MANVIVIKKGAGVPSPDSLEQAELALDTTTGDLYTKLADNSVVQLNDGADDVDLSDYVKEAPEDGKQYARQNAGWSEIVIPDGGTGSSVHIGENPPADPQEGQQWMEVPASGDATMWIYDEGNGGQWLQHPGGKDGADGKDGVDGNIVDGTQDGIVATWDDTAKQWTPDSSLSIDSGGNVVATGGITSGGNSVLTVDDILGTVSQSGGAPTGSIIERGSNANGTYIKFADGTLICELLGPNMSATETKQKDFTFPSAFVTEPICVGSIRVGDWTAIGYVSFSTQNLTPTTNVRAIATIGGTSGTGGARSIAIGRWF